MDLRDIKTLKGIISRLDMFLTLHIRQDEQFFAELRKNTFMKGHVDWIESRFSRIHEHIRSDLSKAAKMADESERRIREGKLSAREINRIFPHILSFRQLVYFDRKAFPIRFGKKTEAEYIKELYNNVHQQGFGKDTRDTIKGWQLARQQFYQSQQFAELDTLILKLSEKVKGHFKLKRSMIPLRRPRLQEDARIGAKTCHMDIFFANDLSDASIKTTLETIFEGFYNRIIVPNHGSTHPLLGKIHSNMRRRMKDMQGGDLRTVQKRWLSDLRDVMTRIFRENSDLILTPRFRCQVRITDDRRGSFFCDSRSLITHYLFGIGITTLVVYYLIGDDFYETFPLGINDELLQTIRKPEIHSGEERQERKALPDPLDGHITNILANMGRHRINSLYGAMLHEAEHAFDSTYITRAARASPVIMHLLTQIGIQKDDMLTGWNSGMMWVAQFFINCRKEAPPMFRELLVPYGEKKEDNDLHELVAPISLDGINASIRALNHIIRELEKDPDRKYVDRRLIVPSRRITPHRPVSLDGLHYHFAHIMNLTIFLADCAKKGIEPVLLDRNAQQLVCKRFPDTAALLSGYSGTKEVPQGSPDAFLIQKLREGDTQAMERIFRTNGISSYHLKDIPRLIQQGIDIHIYRPHKKIMRETLRKIEGSYETGYIDLYTGACETLRIPDAYRMLSFRNIRDLAYAFLNAQKLLRQGAGYYP